MSFYFLTLKEVLYIHEAEMSYSKHDSGMRDINLLKSAIANTELIYENGYQSDLFSLAVSYIRSIAMNHPFIDGNKRTALTTALIFLEFNSHSAPFGRKFIKTFQMQ
ncbi:MAG: type II toxin-antitoxin system death-on-curing family toxin, partial [Vampirovibrionia bacterium]